MAYDGVCFELSLNCPHCEKPIALNRVSESVLCDGCRRVIELPVGFWQSVMAGEIAECLLLPHGEGRNETSIGCSIGVTVQELCGHQMPSCGNPGCRKEFPEEALRTGIEEGVTRLVCPSCGEVTGMRVPPAWFEQIHPLVKLLVEEEGAGDRASRLEGSEGIPFHCYHCGGSLPLDPARRSVECKYCSNQVTVPDEIWVRLNPVAEKKRWFAVLYLGQSAGILPGETDTFCGIASAPDGELIGAYHAGEVGEAGHPCRILRADENSLIRWLQDGVEFDGSSELLLSPGDGTLCIFDDSERFLRFIDMETGDPVCTVDSAPDDEDESAMYLDYCEIACAMDGSLLHHRDGHGLRRFDRHGVRLPLWPEGNEPVSGGLFRSIFRRAVPESASEPGFDSLGDRPTSLPSGALLRTGWDGRLYVLSETADHLAVFDRDGKLLASTALQTEGIIDDLCGFGADREGRVFILFVHSKQFRDTTYPHLARILPGGPFEMIAGPCSGRRNSFLGESVNSLAVAPDGHCYVACDFCDMRRVSPEGEIVWRSPGTMQSEADELEELEENMKGKKQVRDRK